MAAVRQRGFLFGFLLLAQTVELSAGTWIVLERLILCADTCPRLLEMHLRAPGRGQLSLDSGMLMIQVLVHQQLQELLQTMQYEAAPVMVLFEPLTRQ